MRRRIIAALPALAAAAWIIGGTGINAADAVTPAASLSVVAHQVESLHRQPAPAAPTTEQLTPESPGAPSSGGSDIGITAPKTGGVRWDEFGGSADEAPEDLDSFIDSVLGWLKTIAAVAGVLGILTCASLMAIGMKGRSEAARKALEGLPVILLATVIAGASWTVVTVFV